GEAAGVDVGDRGHERRAEQAERGPDPAPGPQLAQRDLGRGLDRRGGVGRHAVTTPCTTSVSGAPRARRWPPTSTHTGPPNGSRSSTWSTTPGRTPSPARYCRAALSSSLTRSTRNDCPAGTPASAGDHSSA